MTMEEVRLDSSADDNDVELMNMYLKTRSVCRAFHTKSERIECERHVLERLVIASRVVYRVASGSWSEMRVSCKGLVRVSR